MKALIIGSGGREHALAWKLKRSPQLTGLYIAPGNPGTAELGQNVSLRADDVAGIVEFAARESIDLVVVGPEAALAAGLSDALGVVGIRCFGPGREAARIESSKIWSKQLMAKAGVPTGAFHVFNDPPAAHIFLRTEPWERWRVFKQDGLAAGKGVVVAAHREELEEAIDTMGRSGPFLLEEPLTGEEVSLLALCDGQTAVPLIPAQDHKRLLDGDRGPNTGGMGAFAPLPQIQHDLVASVEEQVFVPTLRALDAAGTPFVGVLYAGLMLTADGPKVLEFNARFGDPETQAILPLLDSDLLEVLLACLDRRLTPQALRWHGGTAVAVVVAAPHYPASPQIGDVISMPQTLEDAVIFQAGTTIKDRHLVTAGGRVLTVVGLGPSVSAAQGRAYGAIAGIHFRGMQFRHDIGWRGVQAEQA